MRLDNTNIFFLSFFLKGNQKRSFPAFHSIILVRTFAEGIVTISSSYYCDGVVLVVACVSLFYAFILLFFFSSSSSLRGVHVSVCVRVFDCVCIHVSESGGWGGACT